MHIFLLNEGERESARELDKSPKSMVTFEFSNITHIALYMNKNLKKKNRN
jgi:hypothetical protein